MVLSIRLVDRRRGVEPVHECRVAEDLLLRRVGGGRDGRQLLALFRVQQPAADSVLLLRHRRRQRELRRRRASGGRRVNLALLTTAVALVTGAHISSLLCL